MRVSDTVLVEDNEYVVLLPLDGEADGCDSCDCGDHECTYEVIIMKIDKNEDGEFLIPVEDDDELKRPLKSSWIKSTKKTTRINNR